MPPTLQPPWRLRVEQPDGRDIAKTESYNNGRLFGFEENGGKELECYRESGNKMLEGNWKFTFNKN